MPITRNFKLGDHEGVTLVELGSGDIGVTTAGTQQSGVFDMVIFGQQETRPFGTVEKYPDGTNSNQVDGVAVVLAFDTPESVNVVIRVLAEIQKNLFLRNAKK